MHGIASDVPDEELRETIGLLQDEGLIAISSGEYRTLAVSSAGRSFLNNRDSITLARMPVLLESSANITMDERSNGKNLDFDRDLFAELRALRKQVADERDVPAYVIFGDVALREMAYYMPNSLDSFSTISGVGTTKLNQFGERFLETIVDYCDQHDLLPREKIGAPRRKRRNSVRKTSPNGRPSLSRSLNETKRLSTEGFSVDEIASERGFASKTIVSHLEKIARAEPEFNLEQLLPTPDKIETIQKALKADGSGYLAPIKEELGDDYSYEEIRMVRLQMERDL